ncbi:MAG: aminomethyl-transferring glycine dehydrogenase subunit GcvPA, partial [Deltaproteobacteria bacterium]|nr:aminomethyl-transferring glycine dehydrogenase subunit GcvPA [Deltaproteobacteria bacterium]
MRYLPHTPEEIASMLETAGAGSLEDLFTAVPPECRRGAAMDLPPAMTEWDLSRHMAGLAGSTASADACLSFVGAGSYEHYVPATVRALLQRSEFYTAYTPYQPEMTQGTLQAIYEYQTMIARLLGMDVANASLYDGASSLAEALLMAVRVTRKKRVAVSRAVHPHYRQVVGTYLAPTGYELVELPFLDEGVTDLSSLGPDTDFAAVALQSPNVFGCLEDVRGAADRIHEAGGLLVSAFSEPLAFGLFRSPGGQGADIACGEGQSFGIPQSFGGPLLGLFATRQKYVRSVPGRLVGKTVDQEGRRGFVLTLATREQHIRREKATSNICTNNSLCALAAAIYLAGLGGSGLRELARLNYDKAEHLKVRLKE